ncbi:MAG TPA: aminopeptidase, partial [Erythrobacter sp.]|nr:aminopeptidase [Erythrobacter sp.]
MRKFAAPLALLLTSTACTTMEAAPAPVAAAADRMVSPILTSPEAVDTLTHAQPQVARVTHVALDLDLDFDAKRVGGTAELSVLAAPGAEEIVLDTNGLEIAQVTDGQGRALSHTVGEPVAEGGKGAPLTIRLDGAETLRIAYR